MKDAGAHHGNGAPAGVEGGKVGSHIDAASHTRYDSDATLDQVLRKATSTSDSGWASLPSSNNRNRPPVFDILKTTFNKQEWRLVTDRLKVARIKGGKYGPHIQPLFLPGLDLKVGFF